MKAEKRQKHLTQSYLCHNNDFDQGALSLLLPEPQRHHQLCEGSKVQTFNHLIRCGFIFPAPGRDLFEAFFIYKAINLNNLFACAQKKCNLVFDLPEEVILLMKRHPEELYLSYSNLLSYFVLSRPNTISQKVPRVSLVAKRSFRCS